MSDNIPSSNDEVEKSDVFVPFYQKLLDFFFGIKNEERIILQKLKITNKELKRLKYHFYNYKKNQISPALGEYFYNIYKFTQHFIKHINTRDFSKSIKVFLIESSLTKEQIHIKEKLTKEQINNTFANSKNLKSTIVNIQKLSLKFFKLYSVKTIKTINLTYNQITDLSNIINFDWFFLLHKFDSAISEGNFNYKPNFDTLDGQYVIDELITLNDYVNSLNFSQSWKNVMIYLDKINTSDLKLSVLLSKLLKLLKFLKETDYLTKMNKLILKNPDFTPKQFSSNEKIIQNFVSDFQREIKKNTQEAIQLIKKSKINKLLISIFKTSSIVRLKNYSTKFDALLLEKGIKRFVYIEPLNYLKAFLLDFCKGLIKPRLDFYIIKGEWETASHSLEYTRLLERINVLSDKIIAFDNDCSETGAYGKELRKLLLGAKHNQKSQNLAKRTVIKIDSEAYQLMIESIEFFTLLGKKLKELLDELNRKIPKFIRNINKVKWDFTEEPKVIFNDIYKKLYNFIILLKTYVK